MKKIFLIPAVLTALVLCSTHALAQETSDAGQINILENGQIDGLTEWVIVGVADKPENNYVKEQILAYDANESHGSDWSGSLKIGNIDLKNGFKQQVADGLDAGISREEQHRSPYLAVDRQDERNP